MENTDINKDLASDVNQALKNLGYDVTQRNQYMNTRENYLYGNGLYAKVDVEVGRWFAEYNYLPRIINIHASQLMGRGFNIYSYYDKEDLSVYEGDDEQLKMAQLQNKKRKANADARKKAVDAMIRDNGGMARFKDGAKQGSAFGTTVYKMWYEKGEKKVRFSLLESVQNYYAGWSDGDFRERDFDAFVRQISVDAAYREYGDKLGENEEFQVSKYSEPFEIIPDVSRMPQTERPMVTVVEFTGHLSEWGGSNGTPSKVKRAQETPINVLVVGGKVCQVITKKEDLPRYYVIPNRIALRRAWGESDLPQSALDINQEIVQLEMDSMTWVDKTLFKKFLAVGFTPEAIPKWKRRKTQMVAAADGQDIKEVSQQMVEGDQFRKQIEARIQSLVRVTEVGRVLFDDPDVNTGSNQALITTMKPVLDVVEDKQARWEPVLRQMFEDALHLAARDLPPLKEAVEADDNWFLCIEWPSVLRREDAAYQQMWLNRLINGTVSLETYSEKMGDPDTSEEIDRIRDEIRDPVTAAILGKQLGEMAHQTINKSLGIPPWGYVVPKVNVRGELSPQEMGNIAHNYQWDSGPYGPAIGPQGFEGAQANQDFTNTGFVHDTAHGPQADYQGPQQNPNPQLTPDQNQGMPSTAGSGLPQPTSAEGAIAKNNQNRGG